MAKCKRIKFVLAYKVFHIYPEPVKTLQMKRKSKERDRHLDTPAEANRDKHINFVALEAGDADPANQPRTGKLRHNNSKDNKKKPGSENKRYRK